MNRLSIPVALSAALLLFATGSPLRSQQAVPKPPQVALTEIRVANDAILKKQAETLIRLETLAKEAEQLRIFTKRS